VFKLNYGEFVLYLEGESTMTAFTQTEEKLIAASAAGDLTAIVDIVSKLSVKEKETINPAVYDKVLYGISHQSTEPVERAYTTMMFVRHVGRYISPATVSALLKKPEPSGTPPTFLRKALDIQQFIAQNAPAQRKPADITRHDVA
jgi:hypothetical protein